MDWAAGSWGGVLGQIALGKTCTQPAKCLDGPTCTWPRKCPKCTSNVPASVPDSARDQLARLSAPVERREAPGGGGREEGRSDKLRGRGSGGGWGHFKLHHHPGCILATQQEPSAARPLPCRPMSSPSTAPPTHPPQAPQAARSRLPRLLPNRGHLGHCQRAHRGRAVVVGPVQHQAAVQQWQRAAGGIQQGHGQRAGGVLGLHGPANGLAPIKAHHAGAAVGPRHEQHHPAGRWRVGGGERNVSARGVHGVENNGRWVGMLETQHDEMLSVRLMQAEQPAEQPCPQQHCRAQRAHRSTSGSSLAPGITWLPKARPATGCSMARVLNSWEGCGRVDRGQGIRK